LHQPSKTQKQMVLSPAKIAAKVKHNDKTK